VNWLSFTKVTGKPVKWLTILQSIQNLTRTNHDIATLCSCGIVNGSGSSDDCDFTSMVVLFHKNPLLIL